MIDALMARLPPSSSPSATLKSRRPVLRNLHGGSREACAASRDDQIVVAGPFQALCASVTAGTDAFKACRVRLRNKVCRGEQNSGLAVAGASFRDFSSEPRICTPFITMFCNVGEKTIAEVLSSPFVHIKEAYVGFA